MWVTALMWAFSIVTIVLLASVSGLECCQCVYVENTVEQCGCRSNPEKRNCLNDTEKSSKAAAIFGVSGRKEAGTNDTMACRFTTAIVDHKRVVSRFDDTSDKDTGSSCKLKKQEDVTIIKATNIESCSCNTDWCNCNGGSRLLISLFLLFTSVFLARAI